MAFEYTPYRNPYIGTIADLMARGKDAKAKALIDVASAQARAAEAKGQIYGNAISNIGQGIAKSLTDYNDPKRKLQEMAFNQAATDARAEAATRSVLGQTERPMVRTAVPGTPFDAATINIVPPDQQAVGSRAFSSVGFGAPVQPRSPQSLFGTTEVGTQSITPDSTFVESQGPARPKFIDPETGIFDLNSLQQEYSNLRDVDGKPFSPAVLAGRLKPIQEINEAILDYDSKKDLLNKSQQVAFGTMANGVLKFVEDNGGSYTDAARMAVMPWEKRLGKEAVGNFMRNFERLAPQQQAAQLEALRNQASALLPNKSLAKDTVEVDAFGREIARGVAGTPPNPTRASFLAIANDPTKTPAQRAEAQKSADDLKPIGAVQRNSQESFNVTGLGNVPLTIETGPAGQQTRYFYEGPDGRVEKFAGVDFRDKPQASVVLNAGIDAALSKVPEWALTPDRPLNVSGSNVMNNDIGLTPNGLYQQAIAYIDTGQSISRGRSNSPLAVASKAAIEAKAGAIAQEAGMDISEFRAVYAANKDSLKKLTANQATVTSFISTADKNADRLLSVLDKIPDSNATVLNSVMRGSSQKLGGNVDMAEFNVYLKSVKDEYGRIVSQPNLTGILTDSARREAALLLDTNATVAQIKRSLIALKAEGQNRVTSLSDAVSSLRSSMRTNKPGSAPAATDKNAADYLKEAGYATTKTKP